MDLFTGFFCKHDWDKISEVTLPGEGEIIHSNGLTPNTWNSFKGKYVLVLACKKCGKVHKVIEKGN